MKRNDAFQPAPELYRPVTPAGSFVANARDVAAICVDQGFDFLNAPVKCVTAPHTPVPFSGVLEKAFQPNAQDVLDAVGEMG